MPLKNKAGRYGSVTKFFHWSVFLLFVFQFVGANLMTRLGRGDTAFGFDGDAWYNGHKSIGLVLLLLVVGRYVWRRTTPLLRWHDSLSPVERTIASRLETALYAFMFALPISGYLFVMAGGYGIDLFGLLALPNPIGKREGFSTVAWISHIVLAYGALVAIAWHVGLMIRKHAFERTGLIDRMLPFKR